MAAVQWWQQEVCASFEILGGVFLWDTERSPTWSKSGTLSNIAGATRKYAQAVTERTYLELHSVAPGIFFSIQEILAIGGMDMIVSETQSPAVIVRIHDDFFEASNQARFTKISHIITDSYKRRQSEQENKKSELIMPPVS